MPELRESGSAMSPTSSPPNPPSSSAQALALTTTVRDQLTPTFIREALTPYLAKYRARRLTIEVVVLSLLELLLHGLPSLAALVRRLCLGQLTSVGTVMVTTQAFYQRLHAVPHTVFVHLLQQVVRTLAPDATPDPARAGLAPFATGIYALDDTTLDALARKSESFVRPATHPKYVPLAGRLGCVVDVVTGLFHAVAYDSDPTSHERHRLEPLAATLPAGALVVLDRGYFAFDLFDALSARFLYFITRMKEGVVWRTVHTFVDTPHYRDRLVWLGGEKSTEAMQWPVRLVEIQRPDQTWWRYVTNVWDPCILDAVTIVQIYATRWTIERAYAAIKRALGLHALYPCQLNGLLIQVWCTLLLYQLLQVLRTAVATSLTWQHDEVSWPKLVEAITLYAEQPRTDSLRTWLESHAAPLELRVRQPKRRKRVTFDGAIVTQLRTPPVPLTLAAITPRRPIRRPSRVKRRPSERFLANFFEDSPRAIA